MNEIIKRAFPFERRESKKGIAGYCFRFSETIDVWGQLERFDRNLKVDMHERGTYLFRGHDPEKILGKFPDTLKIEVDNEGLFFSADFIDTPLWRETKELIDKKVLSGVSVGFTDLKSRTENKVLIYERVRLWEISCLVWPAYESSELKSRAKIKEPLSEPLPPELF